MSAVTVEHLVKRYGSCTAVRDISFDAGAGQVTALLGPNGAGKSTIIEILAGLLAPSSGTVRVLGADPRPGQGGRPGRAWRARLGVVLQSASVDPQLTVAEALRLFARLYPRPLPVAEVLDVIGLAAGGSARIGTLSGGQRRRVDLGLGIIGRPDLLFLDEPTTGLDPEARRALWKAIENLTAGGTTVLLTTHYLDEAQQLASRLIVLAAGRIVADASPDQLRSRGNARTAIRLPLPSGVPVDELPPRLAGHADTGRGHLLVRTADVPGDLQALISWARRNRLDLAGLEVGPPSLEEAYLALTGESVPPPSSREVLSHA